MYGLILQVRSVDVQEALRLQKENNFVILDVRPEAEFKEVSEIKNFSNDIWTWFCVILSLWCF